MAPRRTGQRGLAAWTRRLAGGAAALLLLAACSDDSSEGPVTGSGGAGGAGPAPTDCSAVTCYFVREAATGSGDGSDWSNAYPALPEQLERGAVYLVAAGTYGDYIFDDELDGERVITVKKATAEDHGTDAGWEAGFAEPAELGAVEFHRSFYVLDGQIGGGRGSYRAGHGFRIHRPDGGFGLTIGAPWATEEERLMDRSDITVRHVEVYGPSPPVPCSTVGGGGVSIAGGTDGHSRLRLSHLWLHDLGIPMQGSLAHDVVLEQSCLERNASSSDCHSEGWAAWGPSDHVVVRNNLFSDIEGTAVIALGRADYWDVYLNVFTCAAGHPYGCGVGNGIVGTTDHEDQQANYWNVHHNVFVNLAGGYNGGLDLISSVDQVAEGNTAYNNIWFANDTGPGFAGVEHDYNWFFQNEDAANDEALVAAEPHGQLGAADPFVDWQGDDFHLNGPTEAGTLLPAPFDTDPDGRARGADGTWDRGLFEYP